MHVFKLKIALSISYSASHCTQKQLKNWNLHCLFSLYMYFDALKAILVLDLKVHTYRILFLLTKLVGW